LAALDAFPAGVWLVELAPLIDPSLVTGTIAQTLGMWESGERTLWDALVAYLRPRQTLVVLDNCEHLLPAAPLVAELVAACPSLRVLATSRAPLHLRGEQQYPVPPLAMPDVPAVSLTRETLDRLAGVASVTLFVQRA